MYPKPEPLEYLKLKVEEKGKQVRDLMKVAQSQSRRPREGQGSRGLRPKATKSLITEKPKGKEYEGVDKGHRRDDDADDEE